MQTGLFDDSVGGHAYAPFGELPDDYPRHEFKPLHPAFKRKGYVESGEGQSKRKFYVDLEIGECDCGKRGYAWGWDHQKSKWYPASYCSHKLKMLSSIVDGAKSAEDAYPQGELFQAYVKAVGSRYNQWEVASAFHKELRRGDFRKAYFWGLMLGTKRGTAGIFKYLMNIVYEETRDHVMAEWLVSMNASRDKQSFGNIAKAISWFCQSKKKWQLPHRLEIFEAEMRGYKQLVSEYGIDVAKGSNIIEANQKVLLLDDVKRGFSRHDLVRMQHGLKGLQKLKYDDFEQHRYWLYEQLYDYADAMFDAEHGLWSIVSVINARISAGFGIGYHELNALADAIAGEPIEPGNTGPAARKRVLAAPAPDFSTVLGIWPAIPLYAQDNHTYRGKALIRKFPEELEPGAKQEHIDFRLCGAYYGVAWRMLAYNQHQSVDVGWHDVAWPKWLINTVKSLWY